MERLCRARRCLPLRRRCLNGLSISFADVTPHDALSRIQLPAFFPFLIYIPNLALGNPNS